LSINFDYNIPLTISITAAAKNEKGNIESLITSIKQMDKKIFNKKEQI
jgi:hypothetical protein